MAQRSGEKRARRLLCPIKPRAAVVGSNRLVQPDPVGLWKRASLKFNVKKYADDPEPAPRKTRPSKSVVDIP